MKALQAYIDQQNKWNAMFKGRQYEIQTHAGRKQVAESIDAALSPENLSCDGELPRSQVQARYRTLTASKWIRELLNICTNFLRSKMTDAQKMQLAIDKLNEAKELMIEALGKMEFVMDHVVNIETMIDELEYYRQEELENE